VKLQADFLEVKKTYVTKRNRLIDGAGLARELGQSAVYDDLMAGIRTQQHVIELLERSAATSPHLYAGQYSALRNLAAWPGMLRRRQELQATWWRGENLSEKSILLHPATSHCDGFGDQIQFIRYASLLAKQGARVFAEVRPELAELFACLHGIQMVPYGQVDLPPHDYSCPYIFLPAECGTTLETIPPAPYLRAPERTVDRWRRILERHAGPKIALVWSGKPDAYTAIMGERWIDFDLLRPLLDVIGIVDGAFLSVRKGMAEAELEQVATEPRIAHVGDEFEDFSDTAAVLALCDLVITIDGSVAHLAGAMGVQTWLMAMKFPHWFFGTDGETTPWYRSVRIFRQMQSQEWRDVIDQVALELIRFLRSPDRAGARPIR
jgi:hypothetical protein